MPRVALFLVYPRNICLLVECYYFDKSFLSLQVKYFPGVLVASMKDVS